MGEMACNFACDEVARRKTQILVNCVTVVKANMLEDIHDKTEMLRNYIEIMM